MSDSERDSNFDEVEEAEFGLYAQLYFEPNPDYEAINLNPDLKRDTAGKIQSQVEVSGCSVKDRYVPKNKEKSSSQAAKLPNRNIPNSQTKVSRIRQSSICSVDSIPGSIPLDDLYCTNLVSDNEIEETDKALAINKVYEQEIASQKKLVKSTTAKKRKRISESSESDIEESKCDSIAKKNGTFTTSNVTNGDESDDLYLVPQSPKRVAVVTLSSPSDDESKLCKKKSKKIKDSPSGIKIKSSTIKYIKQKLRKGDDETESDSDIESLLMSDDEPVSLTMNIAKSINNFVGSKDSRSKGKNKILSKTKHAPSCEKWTPSMASFYDSDISEDLHVEEVHEEQSDSPEYWSIDKEDYPVFRRNRYFNREIRCNRCRQFGHSVRACPRIPHCHLCAETSHTQRHQCPQNCCFRCGEDPHVFCKQTSASSKCHVCDYRGHESHLCPDLWRRFHITTSNLEACVPDQHHPRHWTERYCCVCSSQGHYGHECPRKHMNRFYFQVPQTVYSYEQPVNLVNKRLVVNTVTHEPNADDVTKIRLKPEKMKKISGGRGLIRSEIQRHSEAKIFCSGKVVKITGTKGQRTHAKELIDVILGKAPPEDHKDFIIQIAKINHDPNLFKYLKYLYSKNTSAVFENQGLAIEISDDDSDDTTSKVDSIKSPSSSKPSTVSVNETEDSVEGSPNTENKSSEDWASRFLHSLPRSRNQVLSRIDFCLKEIKSADFDIKRRVKMLHNYKKLLKTENTPRTVSKIEKVLREVSRVVIGREKYGYGKEVHKSIIEIKKDVQSSKESTMPQELCSYLANVLENIYSPSVDKMDVLLQYAEKFVGKNLNNKSAFNHKKAPKSKTKGKSSSFSNSPVKKGKYIDGANKCKHNRIMSKCWHCQHTMPGISDKPEASNVKKKNRGKKTKACRNGCISGKCKRCVGLLKFKRNSKDFWDAVYN